MKALWLILAPRCSESPKDNKPSPLWGMCPCLHPKSQGLKQPSLFAHDPTVWAGLNWTAPLKSLLRLQSARGLMGLDSFAYMSDSLAGVAGTTGSGPGISFSTWSLQEGGWFQEEVF